MKSNPSTGSDEPETIADEIHGIRIMLQADRVALRQGIMDSEEGFVSFLKGFDYTLTEVMKLEAKAALEAHSDAALAALDRDRKMKAELANSLKGLAVDIGSVRLELTSTKALDSPRLDFVQSELLKEAAKLEAADSKTEASE